jgi:hypothetical protein
LPERKIMTGIGPVAVVGNSPDAVPPGMPL